MKGSLLETNPWLRNPQKRAALLHVSAATSSAVEGIKTPFRDDARGKVTLPSRKPPRSEPEHG